MAITVRKDGRWRSSTPTVTSIRQSGEYANSDQNAVSKVRLNYPILFLGTVGVALLIYWHRERTKNVFEGVPILTVTPSTDADRSTVTNLLRVVDVQQSILDAENASRLN